MNDHHFEQLSNSQFPQWAILDKYHKYLITEDKGFVTLKKFKIDFTSCVYF